MNIDIRKLGNFVDGHYKGIILAWIIVFIVSTFFASHLFSLISYNITNSPQNSSDNSVQLAVIVGNNIYSNSTRSFFSEISGGFTYRNITSIYSIEYGVLNSTYNEISNISRPALMQAYSRYNLTSESSWYIL